MLRTAALSLTYPCTGMCKKGAAASGCPCPSDEKKKGCACTAHFLRAAALVLTVASVAGATVLLGKQALKK